MISAKPWGPQNVIRLFAGVIVTFCVGLMLAGLLQGLHSGPASDQLEFAQTVIVVLLFQGAALVWIGIFLRQSNTSWREAFGLQSVSPVRAIAAGIGAGLVGLPFMWVLQWVSQTAMEALKLNPVAQAAVTELQNSHLSVLETVIFGILTILLAPIAEETLFRGILYPTIKQIGRPRLALWGTSALFGIIHFNLATLVPLIFLAVGLAMLYEYTESLLTPIAAHSIFNAVNFFYVIFSDPIDHTLHDLFHLHFHIQ